MKKSSARETNVTNNQIDTIVTNIHLRLKENRAHDINVTVN